jgi:hypothetical protein
MSTALAPVEKTASKDADSLVVSFPVTEQQLAEIKQTLTGLTVEKDGYETVRKGIASTRELRGRVEARRKELKEDALNWGRKVDAAAKVIIESLEASRMPLKLEKKKADDEKERKRKEAEEAEPAKIEGN